MAQRPGTTAMQASVVAIGNRALAIEGPPGSGKSSLALALIDRGAGLIGDDGVILTRTSTRLLACPPPHIEGLIELRGVGLVTLPVSAPCPLALILSLRDSHAVDRLPDCAAPRDILGTAIPTLAFAPGTIAPAIRAEHALRLHGLMFDG